MPRPNQHWPAVLRALRSSLVTARPRRRARRPVSPPCWPLEQLEARLVPTAYTVTTLADGVAGSLRDAITHANADHGTDTVNFKPGLTGTIVLSGGELHITDDLTITGPGADKLTVSGNNNSRIFTVDQGQTVTISGLTIEGGNAGSGDGGGLDNFGKVTVSNSVFTSNSAYVGGGLTNESGGTASVSGSTFTSNSATYGGGLANESGGTASVSGSTFTSNSATFGGGLANFGTATCERQHLHQQLRRRRRRPLQLRYGECGGSTFTSNSATVGGGLDNYGTASASVSGSTFTATPPPTAAAWTTPVLR